jgi:hypothetical protein
MNEATRPLFCNCGCILKRLVLQKEILFYGGGVQSCLIHLLFVPLVLKFVVGPTETSLSLSSKEIEWLSTHPSSFFLGITIQRARRTAKDKWRGRYVCQYRPP